MSWSLQWVFFVSGVIIYEYKDPYLRYNAVTMFVIIIQLLSVIDDDNPESISIRPTTTMAIEPTTINLKGMHTK